MNPFLTLRAIAAKRREAAQIAARDLYADLVDVVGEETGRGIHFERDGARVVGPGPEADL